MARSLARLRQKHPHIDPASLIASFLILHELTAVLPLFGTFGALQYLNAGAPIIEQLKTWTQGTVFDAWISEAEAKAGRMLKKGYFKNSADEEQIQTDKEDEHTSSTSAAPSKVSSTLTNVAASYLVVKVRQCRSKHR